MGERERGVEVPKALSGALNEAMKLLAVANRISMNRDSVKSLSLAPDKGGELKGENLPLSRENWCLSEVLPITCAPGLGVANAMLDLECSHKTSERTAKSPQDIFICHTLQTGSPRAGKPG